MRYSKKTTLFILGGAAYVALELLYRRRSHVSMFLAGGSCFLLLGKLEKTEPGLPLIPRALMGTLVITSVELLAGLLFNRNYAVWDYRHLPGNFYGQICLPYSLLWLPLSLAAMKLYRKLDNAI